VEMLLLRPIVVEILLLIFHQQKIGTESGVEMLREVEMLPAQIILMALLGLNYFMVATASLSVVTRIPFMGW
jgi:hypothetical protein